jgi:LacI family sucrose operon transcriptional repressor
MDVVKERGVSYVVMEEKLDIVENYKKLAYKLFKEHPDIDGVFASSDMIAASLIQVGHEFNKKIPEDIKIVGYDDINIASLIVPPLTTIKQPIEDIGKLLIKVLIDKVENKEVELENILPITLVERKTT